MRGRSLRPIADRTAAIRRGDVLAVVVPRNEIAHLPEFLDHYRGLGVAHMLGVDNACTDGGDKAVLADQPDVSL